MKNKNIAEIVDGKYVLFVPIYSARSYETGIYNLALDGNMARITSKLITSNFDHAVVLIPENHSGLETIILQLSKAGKMNDVTFLECDCYGENAYETRMNGDKFIDFINGSYDLIEYASYSGELVMVIEPNTLAYNIDKVKFYNMKNVDTVYWCVASVTSKGTPWFVNKFADMDKQIAKNIPTECVLQSQVEALRGKAYLDGDGFYDTSAFDYKTIFFPFRLSDIGYHAKEFKYAIESLSQDCKNKIKVLYTDVNDSGIFNDDEVFTKVPGQKEVYIGILKGKPIIPYLDDSDIITHINIHEMMYYGCDMIMFDNDTYKHFDNVTMIHDISELKSALERRIKNEK